MNDASSNYELLDFGDGRKLERFGPVILNRPCPPVDGVPLTLPDIWQEATARFRGPRTGDGSWAPAPRSWKPPDWHFAQAGSASFRLDLEPLPSGQVGIFPEQRELWEWVARQAAKTRVTLGRPPRVLNLFAYTGGSTLAAAAAGAEVVHIDAVQNIVDRARRNAESSKLADRPIRWIAEDATKFCQRELKRGNQYDAVMLDPPTYGHGSKGQAWKIGEHLLPLLKICGQLTAEHRAFVLLSCHTPGIGPAELGAYLADGIFGSCAQPARTGELNLETASGRRLPSGVFARWPA